MKNSKLILIIMLLCFTSYSQAQNTDTLKLYYGIDINELNANHKVQIDSFLNKTKQFKILKISINGFTDYLAGDAYNKALSIKRANNVKKYILDKLIDRTLIKAYGKGKLPPELKDNKEGIQGNRKVEIIVYSKTKDIAKHFEENNNEEIADEKEIIKVKDPDNVNDLENESKKITDLEVGEQIILKNVNFYPGRHFPMEEAKPALENLLQVMKDNPDLEIEIQGHICCVPYEHDCYDYDTKRDNLSKERAKYVYNYLIRNGIDKSRLSHKGYGARYKLVKPEITETDRMKNRRVEVKIIKK